MSKVISLRLSTASINNAIKELNAYRSSLDDKCARLAHAIAERIRWSAESGFSSAVASDIFVGGTPTMADVSVTVEDSGKLCVVIASGTDAVFIEFGAGVYHNGAAGSSPHPLGQSLDFRIGEYGKGMGKKRAWNLPGSTHKTPVLTHGTPAAMPMYHGVQEVVSEIADLARGVFAT